MRLVCISDTHLQHDFDVPHGDVLIHAGDALLRGNMAEFQKFAMWFCYGLPHRHKIFVPGNHDWCFSQFPPKLPGVKTLIGTGCEIEGIQFWGGPWQPEFHNWAFNLPRGPALKEKWDRIPTSTDVLITHGPPFGILDYTPRGENVGCMDLSVAVHRVCPLLHVFGHVHHAYGEVMWSGIHFVNASICNERYAPVNLPVVIDLDAEGPPADNT